MTSRQDDIVTKFVMGWVCFCVCVMVLIIPHVYKNNPTNVVPISTNAPIERVVEVTNYVHKTNIMSLPVPYVVLDIHTRYRTNTIFEKQFCYITNYTYSTNFVTITNWVTNYITIKKEAAGAELLPSQIYWLNNNSRITQPPISTFYP